MRWLAIRTAFAGVLIGTYLSIELAAGLFIVHELGIDRSTYADFYRNDPEYKLVTWSSDFVPHPYVGYVRPHQLRELERLLGERDPEVYLIAILGGSVAEGLASYVIEHPERFEELRSVVPAIGNRRIRAVNLAMGGYKQPQQFIMASYILGHVDMMMNVDGFNEMTKEDLFPVYPTDFPTASLKLFSRDQGRNWHKHFGDALTFIYRQLYQLPIELPPLARSNVYFLIWRGMHRKLFQDIQELEKDYLSGIGVDAGLGQPDSWHRKIEIWQKYTRLQHQVTEAADVPMYFFLQPNQYSKNSKPMSDQERAIAINPRIAEARDTQMTLLRQATAELRAERVPIFDLTQIYRGTLESVYRDACCHVADPGNKIMAEQILATIQRATVANGR